MKFKYLITSLSVVLVLLLMYSFMYAQTVEEAFDAYKTTVKNRQYSSMAEYATDESVQKDYHIMNDFFRDNFLNSCDNNPYTVEYNGSEEAVIYFRESRNGRANPYIFTKENGKWKIDFIKMKQRIVFGEGNKWRWRQEGIGVNSDSDCFHKE